MRYFIVSMLLTMSSFGFEYHLKPYTVTNGVECFFGLYGEAREENGGRVLNTCYIESDGGYIVIDSGPSYSYAQQAYRAMQKRKALPIKYVINTSSEEIHILGNEFYKEQGATLIGPKSYEQLIKKNKLPSLAKKISKDAFLNTRLVPLDRYQNANSRLSVGDMEIEIKKFEKGESQHLVVFVPQKKTVFVGNYVSNGQRPLVCQHRSVKEWQEGLKKIEEISWKYLISAHGTKRNRTALTSTKQYLNGLNKKASIPPKKSIHKKSIHKKRINPNRVMLAKKEVPNIHYTNFSRAKQEAIRENKLIMVKIEANNCKPCDTLNSVLATNNHIKKMVNQHIKAVKVNSDYDDVPIGLSYMGTPAVFLIQPKDDKILMQLEGGMAVTDLEASLQLFLNDGFRVGLASL